MPAKLFFDLNEKKKTKIIKAAMAEFASRGYLNASTNAIVKNAEISKGSLFKYFAGKEELYFYLLDTVTAELAAAMEKETASLPAELFERVTAYAVLEFSWYIQNPVKSKLVIGAFAKSDADIYHKTISRYAAGGQKIFYGLLENIDMSNFRWDKRKTLDILKWFLKGFNEDFLAGVRPDGPCLEQLRSEYVQTLTAYMDVLKAGLVK